MERRIQRLAVPLFVCDAQLTPLGLCLASRLRVRARTGECGVDDRMNQRMKSTWNALAARNAMHFIATEREDWDLDSFLESGRRSIAGLVAALEAPAVLEGGTVLDLGCGIGRIAFALAEHFAQVIAVDVSEVMIEEANRLKGLLRVPNVQFVCNSGRDVAMIGSATCDLAFSYIMFQHIPERTLILGYIAEMARVTRPGGKVLLQVPVYRRGPSAAAWRVLQALFRGLLWPLEATRLVPPEKGVAFRGSRLQKSELERELELGNLRTIQWVRRKSTYRLCDDVIIFAEKVGRE